MVPAAHSFVPSGFIDRPWCAESSRYASRGAPFVKSGSSLIRSTLSVVEVVLDEAVEERELEVDLLLVGRQRHRPARRAEVGIAGLGHLLAHVDPLEDHVARAGVDDLELAVALGGIERGRVGRRVDRADACVEDLGAVVGEVVLVRLVAGLDAWRRGRWPVSITLMLRAVEAETSTACRPSRSPCDRRVGHRSWCASGSCRWSR